MSVHACKTVSRSLSVMHKIQSNNNKREKSVWSETVEHIPASRQPGYAADGQFFHFVVVDVFLHGDDILLTLKCLDIWQKVTL